MFDAASREPVEGSLWSTYRVTQGQLSVETYGPPCLQVVFLIPVQSASTYSVSRARRGQDGYPHAQSHNNQLGFHEPFPLLGYPNADQLSGHLHSTRKHRRLRSWQPVTQIGATP